MEAPLCEAVAIGEFTSWARQLLNEWQSESILQLSFEANISKFCHQAKDPGNPRVVILENSPTSHVAIAQVRASNQSLLILWMGQKFTKEDFAHAVKHRVYGILENPTVSNKASQDLLVQADSARKRQNQLHGLVQTLKGLILQTDLGPEQGLVSEIKAGLSKIDRLAQWNEVFKSDHYQESEASSLPIAKSQTLGEVLSTMADLERTGTLWIKGQEPSQEGKIDFLQGKITFAETGSVSQLKAIYRMFFWESPRFLFNRKQTVETSGHLVPLEVAKIVQEGESQLARFERVKKDIPPVHLKLDFLPQTLDGSTAMSPKEFHALIQVVGFHFVGDILDYSDRWDIDVYEGLISLRKLGYIKVDSQATAVAG